MTVPAQESPTGTTYTCSAEGCRGCSLASPDCHRYDEVTAAEAYDRWLTAGDLRARHMRFLMGTAGAFLANTAAFRLAGVLDLRPHHRLVDLGCGRAAVSRILAARAKLETPPVGVDLSRVMLDLARRDQQGKATHAVRLARGSVTALPFADERFDAAVSAHLIKHLPDESLRAFLREAARVLKPGGRFVLWEFAKTGSASADRVNRWMLGNRVGGVRLRTFGEIAAAATESGFGHLRLLTKQPFLYPPIPRITVLFEK